VGARTGWRINLRRFALSVWPDESDNWFDDVAGLDVLPDIPAFVERGPIDPQSVQDHRQPADDRDLRSAGAPAPGDGDALALQPIPPPHPGQQRRRRLKPSSFGKSLP